MKSYRPMINERYNHSLKIGIPSVPSHKAPRPLFEINIWEAPGILDVKTVRSQLLLSRSERSKALPPPTAGEVAGSRLLCLPLRRWEGEGTSTFRIRRVVRVGLVFPGGVASVGRMISRRINCHCSSSNSVVLQSVAPGSSHLIGLGFQRA